ncbi:vitamin K epoxide reductase family protein [Oscillatoria sp. CS-180]|uniref:vitamin K epoxide reductase family protein n=1 Tax=Oscillatoria sp. CS-180 TaxID=3021720 RepID=UPI00232AB73A|nr:vitamin K epoxide reductase family protein [Oscillatoria sp. CS-180]MDB9526899.1 vitamin K epoxide reductase family protein [Oscillatoria sp. CS-180]
MTYIRRRRQEASWIQRWSRWIIGAIALMGALGTAYLTVVKLMEGDVTCPTGGCDRVLSSEYARVFGQPLTLFGCLGYLGMATMALSPFAINPDKNKDLRRKLENITWPLLFMGATAMLVFSAYLMYLLAFEIKAPCLYCITSAVFAATMFVVTIIGRRWDDVGQLAFMGVIVAMVTLIGTLAVYAPINNPQLAQEGGPGEVGPPISTQSSESELQLANHLTDIDAKMYGAWWCPHCHDQKQLFGQEAAKAIPYVECAEDGQNSQTQLCRSVPEVEGFPTWEVNGEFFVGAQSLETLADASGYTGPRNFQN